MQASQNVSNQVKLRVPRIIHSSWVTYWNGAQPSPFPRMFKTRFMNFVSVSVAATGWCSMLSLSHCLHEKSIPKAVVLHHFVLPWANNTTSYEHCKNLMAKVIPTILSCQMRTKLMHKESVNNVVVVVVVLVVVGGGGVQERI